ncbi:hypothetical protein CDL15_Pgr012879 [Punica granatum]|uniref:Uncharacterized protein n=1 Tax=Punica granatum TaxID=22663 RepID=A0A218XF13_PUNGR|nr:hypothetical protein CDL15_Pgr012879 [Punica granatum]
MSCGGSLIWEARRVLKFVGVKFARAVPKEANSVVSFNGTYNNSQESEKLGRLSCKLEGLSNAKKGGRAVVVGSLLEPLLVVEEGGGKQGFELARLGVW